MKLLELTDFNSDRKEYVASDKIATIESYTVADMRGWPFRKTTYESGSKIFFSGMGGIVTGIYKETPEQIVQMIKGAF